MQTIKKNVFIILSVLSMNLSVYSQSQLFYSTLPQGFYSLPDKVQKILLAPRKQITSFSAMIKQTLVTREGSEKRKGYYYATSSGRFRAVFSQPEELIVYDKHRLYYKIAENPFTWVIENGSDIAQPGNPTENTSNNSWQSASYRIVYQPGSWWQFADNSIETYILIKGEKPERSFKVEVKVDTRIGAIVERTLYSPDNRQIMHEKFSKPVFYNKTVFFKKIDIIARNIETGDVVKNYTEYSNIRFNRPLKNTLFKAPEGPYRKYNR